MTHQYAGVTTRFLRDDERLVRSDEKEMPLVIEAKDDKGLAFLQSFMQQNSKQILQDVAKYGAILFRGFAITNDHDFEKSITSIQGFKGISEAFMAEEGREHVGDLKYVLHTNTVYKTGGTLYLGGFHSENYYTPDVPAYISFCCIKPSLRGGETGLINTAKVYQHLGEDLKKKLKAKPYFVGKWLLTEVAERYDAPIEKVEELCKNFDLPIVGEGKDRFLLMYKPSVYEHPITKETALQINMFELPTLNEELRKHFMKDYAGKDWFWHRLVWHFPKFVFSILERTYIMFASFFYSPKNAIKILKTKIETFFASRKENNLPDFDNAKIGTCFSDEEVKTLAGLLRQCYCSCLWQKGDILFVDNRKTLHAGMPGAGPRTIRALIANPLQINYSLSQSGVIDCKERSGETIGYYISQETQGSTSSEVAT